MRLLRHADPGRELRGGGVAGVHLGDDAVQATAEGMVDDGCDRLGGDAPATGVRVENPAHLGVAVGGGPDHDVTDRRPPVLDDQGERAGGTEQVGLHQPVAEPVEGVLPVPRLVEEQCGDLGAGVEVVHPFLVAGEVGAQGEAVGADRLHGCHGR